MDERRPAVIFFVRAFRLHAIGEGGKGGGGTMWARGGYSAIGADHYMEVFPLIISLYIYGKGGKCEEKPFLEFKKLKKSASTACKYLIPWLKRENKRADF